MEQKIVKLFPYKEYMPLLIKGEEGDLTEELIDNINSS